MIRAALAALLLAMPAAAQEGRAVFEARCASCHAVEAGAPPGAGPNLHGIGTRPVASAPGNDYSPALEEARRAGHRWNAERLVQFLADPEAMYPGLWMGGNGLDRADERAAVADYLLSVR